MKIQPVAKVTTGELNSLKGGSLDKKGPSFEEFLRAVPTGSGAGAGAVPTGAGMPGSGAAGTPVGTLRFSQHATERLHSRGIAFKEGEMARIEAAVDKAVQKGSKETLVICDEKALIVNTRSRTVVTVLDTQAMKENVFTNIDSTVLV